MRKRLSLMVLITIFFCNYLFAGELHKAARNGERVKVVSLLKKGFDPNVRDKDYETPLHMTSDKKVAAILLEKNADINARDESGKTPLHHKVDSGYFEIVEFLIGKRADLNTWDSEGETPLHEAVYNGHGQIVELLLEKNNHAV